MKSRNGAMVINNELSISNIEAAFYTAGTQYPIKNNEVVQESRQFSEIVGILLLPGACPGSW